jgi:transcriptional regulator with XRE-family HTH domain
MTSEVMDAGGRPRQHRRMRVVRGAQGRSSSAGALLRRLRAERRASQLELSLRVGVSQRHLSCIETGRARPSRDMLLALLDALEAPLSERNDVLLAAGFAPAFRERSLEQADMAPVREALGHLLAAHEPAPALVLDGAWNLVQANRGAGTLLRLIGVAPSALPPGTNLLRAILLPGPLRDAIVNADEVCAAGWQRALAEAPFLPALRAVVEGLRLHAPPARPAAGDAPMLLTRMRTAAGELRFFSAFTTFGTPLDVTIASLRVEHMFPADEATREALARGTM